ncbi:hypothetical protein GCM10007941_03320 [Amphritea balenae]|nr:hypothetical protein GCM10007941_03320 [Amphritea balenae]
MIKVNRVFLSVGTTDSGDGVLQGVFARLCNMDKLAGEARGEQNFMAYGGGFLHQADNGSA